MDNPIPCIRASNISFRWPNSQNEILSFEKFHVNKNETLFIQGTSGSGKTTLLNLITGVLLPDKGSISILNKEITGLKPALRDQFRADHFGIIFQQFNLINYLSVLENILLPCTFSQRRKLMVETVNTSLVDEASRLINALGFNKNEILHRNVTELSIGQQQRVAVARALIGSPDIIIADEPTSALDADNKNEFLNLLFDEVKRKNCTLLFVSHDSSIADKFDRHIHLDHLS
jgi:putative ABC transport system ATP-binding protein|tara:strand:+ start:1037 stop:1732 length:696 start_codon:yes stop_codon:yes gene_type:complete